MSVRTLKLAIAYDGTDFAGWQRQATERTVQAVIEDALEPIDRSRRGADESAGASAKAERDRVVITGAGRTDAGVHAAGQVASVTLNTPIPSGELQRALNATLPEDVRIFEVADVPSDFNAQFDARQKTYHYLIFSGPVMPPQMRRYAWHVHQPLDVPAMNTAAATLLGTHDFAAFQATGSDVETTVREVLLSRVRGLKPGPTTVAEGLHFRAVSGSHLIAYEVTGTGFLRHMVRNIVGTLVDIGRGRRAADDIPKILTSRDRAQAAATAPPHGLTLWRVEY